MIGGNLVIAEKREHLQERSEENRQEECSRQTAIWPYEL